MINSDFHVEEKFSRNCDLLHIQKRTDQKTLAAAYQCKRRGGTVIFDIDDFPSSREFQKQSRLLAELADAITTATPEQVSLAEKYLDLASSEKLHCLPNALDYGLSVPIPRNHTSSFLLKIVWFGNPENFPHQDVKILEHLENVELHAITSVNSDLISRYSRWTFHEWNYQDFSETLAAFDVCFLSHHGDEISNAKNANKMVTAIMHGLPVLASRTGDYGRLAKLADVSEYLFDSEADLLNAVNLLRDPEKRNAYLNKTQGLVYKEFKLSKIVNEFTEICMKAVGCSQNKSLKYTFENFKKRWLKQEKSKYNYFKFFIKISL